MSQVPNTELRTLRRDLRKGAGLGVSVVATLLSVVVFVGSWYAWASYRSLESKVINNGKISPPKGGWQDVDGKAQNILVVGDDSRAGATPKELADMGTQQNDGDNTDTMMLMHVPADGSAAAVISFPRDSWVQVPGQPGVHSKLNGLYALGEQNGGPQAGMSMLAQGIYGITGLKVDHFVKVGLLGFYRISIALHGVDLCLNETQNAQTDSDSFGSGYSGIDLKKGWNYNVQGKQALAFVRQRHGVPGGDLGRIHRQQYFLTQAFKKISTAKTLLDPSHTRDLLNAVGSSLTRDSSLNLLDFASQMHNLGQGKLRFKTIPVAGTPTIQVDGAPLSIVALDWPKIPSFIQQFVGVSVHPTETDSANSMPGARLLGQPPAAAPHAATPSPSSSAGGGSDPIADCVD